MTATIDENGNRTETAYDANGKSISTTDALGNVTTFTFDANGNQTSMTDANGPTTTFEYDALNRRTRTIFPDGTSTSVVYAPGCSEERKLSETDQAGNTTSFDYDAMGRLLRVTDALGGETAYTYDAVGNKLTQTDPNGHTTSWTYDSLKRAVRRTLPMGQTETYTYDANGNLLSKTDFNGNIITYTYDTLNRLIRKQYPDSSEVSFTFTATGRRESATDSRGVTTYTYDVRDRLLSLTHPDDTVISYSYDNKGNRTSVTVPSGTTTYTYDALNRPLNVTDPNDGVTTYTYDNVGNRASVTYPNGTVAEYTYDALNRLTLLENRKSTEEVISSYSYSLGPAGNRLSVTEDTGRVVNYSYDNLYRLRREEITDAVLGNETIEYTYDAFGNRLTKTDSSGITTYMYNANDQLITETGPGYSYTYTYDSNGNTTGKSDGTLVTTYGYDYENRLISTEDPAGITNYTYDVDGIRVMSETAGDVTTYLVDKNRSYAQVLEETDDSGGLMVRYVYGDDLISQNRSGSTSYYHYDGQMSTRQLTDDSETITDGYVYDAFGVTLDHAGTTENNYLYTGEQYDPNIGFYYLRARYYSQETGRFMNHDPRLGSPFEPLSLHRYLYANANPISNIDPSGELANIAQAAVAVGIMAILVNIHYALITFSSWLSWRSHSEMKWDGELLIYTAGVSVGSIVSEMLGGARITLLSECCEEDGGRRRAFKELQVLFLGFTFGPPGFPSGSISYCEFTLYTPRFMRFNPMIDGPFFMYGAGVIPIMGPSKAYITMGTQGFAYEPGICYGLDIGLDVFSGQSIILNQSVGSCP
jgi:RHS repeat-associated protein